MKRFTATMADNIRTERLAAGISPGELAEKINMGINICAALESGKYDARFSTVVKVAELIAERTGQTTAEVMTRLLPSVPARE